MDLKIFKESNDVPLLVQASCSMPMLDVPVKIDKDLWVSHLNPKVTFDNNFKTISLLAIPNKFKKKQNSYFALSKSMILDLIKTNHYDIVMYSPLIGSYPKMYLEGINKLYKTGYSLAMSYINNNK